MTDTMRVFSDVLLTPEPWMQDALCAQTDPDRADRTYAELMGAL